MNKQNAGQCMSGVSNNDGSGTTFPLLPITLVTQDSKFVCCGMAILRWIELLRTISAYPAFSPAIRSGLSGFAHDIFKQLSWFGVMFSILATAIFELSPNCVSGNCIISPMESPSRPPVKVNPCCTTGKTLSESPFVPNAIVENGPFTEVFVPIVYLPGGRSFFSTGPKPRRNGLGKSSLPPHAALKKKHDARS